MMGMQIEAYDYEKNSQEALKSTENEQKTTKELAHESVDAKTDWFFKHMGKFFKNVEQGKELFKNVHDKIADNPDLDSRVSKLEEKVKLMEKMQFGMEASINANPQLALALNGSVNYNPEAKGKQVDFREGGSLESAFA